MDFQKLDRYLASFYHEKNIPGCGCAVYYRHEPVYSRCFGYADVERGIPFTEDSLVCLYSATKVSTVTCTMRLCEEGLLALDAPVSEWLPEYSSLKVREEDGTLRPARTPLLIRHLLTMQGGYTYDRWPGLEGVRDRTGGRMPTREVIRSLAQVPLVFDPGTHFRYSYCHDILAAVIEAAAGVKFGEALQSRVFGPIGMTSTCFHPSDETVEKRMAVRYTHFDAKKGSWEKADKGNVNMGPDYESGGGGLVSNIRDYILLAETLTNFGTAPNGTRILAPESVEKMRTPQLNEASHGDFAAMGRWSKAGYTYGLGVRTLTDRERNNSLSANGEFGWDGALGCYILSDPENEVSIFYSQFEAGSYWPGYHGMIRNTAYACL